MAPSLPESRARVSAAGLRGGDVCLARVVILGHHRAAIDDDVANLIIAQMMYLESDNHDKE